MGEGALGASAPGSLKGRQKKKKKDKKEKEKERKKDGKKDKKREKMTDRALFKYIQGRPEDSWEENFRGAKLTTEEGGLGLQHCSRAPQLMTYWALRSASSWLRSCCLTRAAFSAYRWLCARRSRSARIIRALYATSSFNCGSALQGFNLVWNAPLS